MLETTCPSVFPETEDSSHTGLGTGRHWWMPAGGICKPTKPVAALCSSKLALLTFPEVWLLCKNKEVVPWILESLLSLHQGMNGESSEPRKFYKGLPFPNKSPQLIMPEISTAQSVVPPINSSRVPWKLVRDANF